MHFSGIICTVDVGFLDVKNEPPSLQKLQWLINPNIAYSTSAAVKITSKIQISKSLTLSKKSLLHP